MRLVIGAFVLALLGCSTDPAGPPVTVHCFGQDSSVGDTSTRVNCPDNVTE